jgi:hypothetical protein
MKAFLDASVLVPVLYGAKDTTFRFRGRKVSLTERSD